MKNNWKEKVYYFQNFSQTEELISFIESLLAEQKKELLENERQFILNVLDGIDIADKEVGVIGGTQAIRQALQSRVI